MSLFISFLPELVSNACRLSDRLRLRLFFVRMWLDPAFLRRTFPDFVIRNLLAAPLFVFIFNLAISLPVCQIFKNNDKISLPAIPHFRAVEDNLECRDYLRQNSTWDPRTSTYPFLPSLPRAQSLKGTLHHEQVSEALFCQYQNGPFLSRET